MLNLSDKELDQLSREASEQFEPDEDISSWEKLEQQLDGEDEDKPPVAPPRFRARPLTYGALLLLLAGSSYFLLKSGNDSKHSTLKTQASKEANSQPANKENNPVQDHTTSTDNNNKVKADNKNEPVSSTTTNEANKETTNSKKNAAIDNSNTLANADQTNSAVDINKLSNQKNSAKDQNNLAKNKSNNKTNNKIRNNKNGYDAAAIGIVGINNNINGQRKVNNKKPTSQKNKNISGIADANSSALLLTQSEKSSGKNNMVSDQTDKPKYAELPGLVLSDNNSADISDSSLRKIVASTDNNQPPAKNQSLHINRSLKIGIMLAPDYTNVGSASNNKLSANVGITLGYEFAHNWSINTGLIYTKKNYASSGKDFHKPYSPYPTPTADFVNGNCSMWEIPLSLRYDFSSTGKKKFFVNAGLSSYLMKHESYMFYYNSSSGGWSRPWDGDTNEKYWFSVASLSIGMEHHFNKNFSLQVEPFIKIPLTGVGLGSLQLNSYGLSFSLRYSPVLSKSRH